MMMKDEYFNPFFDRESELSVFAIGREQCAPTFDDGPSFRKMYILHHILEGSGEYTVGGVTHRVRKGDVFAIRPTDLVYYKTDENDPWLFSWILFHGTRAEDLYRQIGVTETRLVFHGNSSLFSDSILRCLTQAATEKRPLSAFRLTACLMDCLSSVSIEDKPTTGFQQREQYVKTARAFIEYHYGAGISVSDVAEHLGLERSYFYRVFHKETGQSPEQYLTSLRMEKAKKLIRTGLPFKQVATAVGLKDVYYFTKLFKKQFDVTPSAYRRLHSSDETKKHQ